MRAFLQELFAQISALRQDVENLRAAMDMAGI
jgi:outer membrane murein-binding lipoprotein Lpp